MAIVSKEVWPVRMYTPFVSDDEPAAVVEEQIVIEINDWEGSVGLELELEKIIEAMTFWWIKIKFHNVNKQFSVFVFFMLCILAHFSLQKCLTQ